LDYIFNNFPITTQEYQKLDKDFGDLALFAAWQLVSRNKKNNQINEVDDVAQELRMALIHAGSYYKRQVYLESCMKMVREYVTNNKDLIKLNNLEELWKNKTKHGAGKQKFGLKEEEILEKLVNKYVPIDKRPDKKQPLIMDKKFTTYCKTIAWNRQKYLGKKITKERSFRVGCVSLSEHAYLDQE
jgi:hypothetical protein